MRHLFTALSFLIPYLATGQLYIIVTDIPTETPVEDDIYLAGNINGWNPGDDAYILELQADDTRMLTINPDSGMIEFKFTRGSWETVEGNEFGGYLPNRVYNYTGGPDTLYCSILTWEDTGGPISTAAENVSILSSDFYMPQLDTYRRIWIYLPPDYETSGVHYKVLYMHDGQNVFDLSTSFAGEWEVDETLNELHASGDAGCIVVAIDNGGSDRLEEYSPWIIPPYDVEGRGELYMQFIVETLKPYIDDNYRTLTDRDHTGLMGSSIGGLITMYGGMAYPEIFGKLGVFSPSYWVNDSCFIQVSETEHSLDMRIYTIAGALEGITMTDNVNLMELTLDAAGLDADEHTAIIHADGQHSEWYWAREFEAAYQWLWDASVYVDAMNNPDGLMIYPNPANEYIQLTYNYATSISSIQILSPDGRLYSQYAGNPASMLLPEQKGLLLLRVNFSDGRFATRLFLAV